MLLQRHGFSFVYTNPLVVNRLYFHQRFRQSLDDIWIQKFNSLARNSSSLRLLGRLKDKYELSLYLCKISSIETRKIFTRLRIDQNVTKGLSNEKE